MAERGGVVGVERADVLVVTGTLHEAGPPIGSDGALAGSGRRPVVAGPAEAAIWAA
jgi:hypothetical protein